jgi:hypothetical protein
VNIEIKAGYVIDLTDDRARHRDGCGSFPAPCAPSP